MAQEICKWNDTEYTYIIERIPLADIDEDSDEWDAYRVVGIDSDNVRRIDIAIDPAYGRWNPDEKQCLDLLTALWSADGVVVGEGNSDLSGTALGLAKLAGIPDQWHQLRDVIIEMLRNSSHIIGPGDNWEAYSQERQTMGVVTLGGTEVAWWDNGGETRWMDVDDLDGDERSYVGLGNKIPPEE